MSVAILRQLLDPADWAAVIAWHREENGCKS